MATPDRFVLPEDVVIAPIAEMPDEIRRGVEHKVGDCAVTRPRSRGNSTVVDARSAGLLECFRSPSTIVEAVIAFSAAEGLDPRETLDGAFDVLSGFVADGLLLTADSKLAEPITTSLGPGEQVGGCEVVEAIHVILDSEVYLASASDGTLAALKIARSGAELQLAAPLAREAAILEHLDGALAPRLLETGMHEGRPFIVVSWCAGVDVFHAANEARALDSATGRDTLLRVAENVIDAYARLHERGVLHGDVHPRNILVESDGAIRLIDFGLASRLGEGGVASGSRRGGVDFFLEPEVAAARLAQAEAPLLSVAGEQYALGALVYLLLTGENTQDFSLEPEEMLRQLTELPPVPFDRRGTVDMPAVEQTLRRALAKDPAARYGSTADFLDAFRLAASADRECPLPPTADPPPSRSPALLEEVLKRLAAPDGELFRQGISAPTASAMNGGAGFAYALMRIAGIREDESMLALADLWAVRARLGADSNEAFWNAELEIVPEVFGESSFYHHLGGVDCVLALIASARADEWAMGLAAEGFVASATKACEPVDVAFGAAGLLLGASLLLEALSPAIDGAALRAAGDGLRDRLWGELRTQLPLAEGPQLRSLGAAHGWAGCLFALLRWSEASATPPPPELLQRLDQLGAMAQPLGRGLRWPYDAGMPMPHTGLEASWCNGAAGYVFLWTTAHRLTGEERYAGWAQMAGWTAYESQTPSVGDLCCGFAGRAYALLSLFRHGGDEAWLARSRLLAERAAKGVRSDALRRDSLYKGEIGVALLEADLERPEYACMPLFEPECVR